MFGYGPFGRRAVGDSNYIFSGGKPTLSLERDKGPGKYTGQVDMGNRANYPVEAPDVQRQFPASLLMSGTRDLGLSRTVFAHRSEERRVGKECVSPCSSRWSPNP